MNDGIVEDREGKCRKLLVGWEENVILRLEREEKGGREGGLYIMSRQERWLRGSCAWHLPL